MTAVLNRTGSSGRLLSAAESDHWQARAGCRSEDPELFFPVGTSPSAVAQSHRAAAVCARCPVRAECEADAMGRGEEFGIWGGYSPEQRANKARQEANLRKREALRGGAALALAHGEDVLLRVADGADTDALAYHYKVSVSVVRKALRLLLPPTGRAWSDTGLECALIEHGPQIRQLVRAGKTDREIAAAVPSQPHTVAEARIIIGHQEAAYRRLRAAREQAAA